MLLDLKYGKLTTDELVFPPSDGARIFERIEASQRLRVLTLYRLFHIFIGSR